MGIDGGLRVRSRPAWGWFEPAPRRGICRRVGATVPGRTGIHRYDQPGWVWQTGRLGLEADRLRMVVTGITAAIDDTVRRGGRRGRGAVRSLRDRGGVSHSERDA